MSELESEPVEISTVLGPGEWTEETLVQLVDAYRGRIIEMGATADDLHTSLDRSGNGSIAVSVLWDRRGTMPEVVEHAPLAGLHESHGFDRTPTGHAGSPLMTGASGPGFGPLSTPGLPGEKITRYTDADGTTWLEGRSDSQR